MPEEGAFLGVKDRLKRTLGTNASLQESNAQLGRENHNLMVRLKHKNVEVDALKKDNTDLEASNQESQRKLGNVTRTLADVNKALGLTTRTFWGATVDPEVQDPFQHAKAL